MTNSNLIPVFNGLIQNQPVQLCNARELHSFLEIQTRYNDWVKNRINEYGFIQDEDYLVITERTNGRPRKEYHITLDMGKELGMVERNERGRQIRKYFIECERRASQPKQIALPEPENKFTFEFTEYELQQLAWLWFAFKRGVGTFQHIEKAFNVLGSNMSSQIYGQAYEYLSVLRSTNQILNRITNDFDIDQMTNWRVLKHLRDFNPKAVKIDF
ncbi:P22AR C-terminal domain-containing protein [Haemophilus parainfluenzae]|uniref:AntA/AntB antirepressor family protein n=1 Tax=Haemophilus parainfluenzae TaxID=729 RepID=A0A7M1NV54_HAEPA|nr:P22AR C-terminal domain-containing protein [Haemophilus parainfluenzae]QOR16846.1 antA/AntB antirepressor family protein [Haemophilus parainfluenzae]